jgi:hypothetical protein
MLTGGLGYTFGYTGDTSNPQLRLVGGHPRGLVAFDRPRCGKRCDAVIVGPVTSTHH